MGGPAVLMMVLGLSTATAADKGLRDQMVPVPGGTFVTDDESGDPNEVRRRLRVAPFELMRHEVTNQQFAAFVAATGHQTDPETRGPGYVWTRRWGRMAGANWRFPHGPDTPIDQRMDHPVVQVSARDATAFCAWHGLRLPSEAEWEFAARGPEGWRYPWGNRMPSPGEARLANYGTDACCAPDTRDGYARTAPVGSYPKGASPFGLQDMAGNVWEWTASRFPGKPQEVVLKGGGWGNNPYCLRTAYRHGNPADIGLDMVGFRCAGDRS